MGEDTPKPTMLLLSATVFDRPTRATHDLPLPKALKSAILASKPPEIWRMST
jgi:hypothetical protein